MPANHATSLSTSIGLRLLQPRRGHCTQGREPERYLPPTAKEESEQPAHLLGVALAAIHDGATRRRDGQQGGKDQRPPLTALAP